MIIVAVADEWVHTPRAEGVYRCEADSVNVEFSIN